MKYLLTERVLRLGLALFVGVLAARVLGEVDYGILALALTIGHLALVMTNLGVDGLLVREYTRFPNFRFLQNIFQLQMKVAVLIFLLSQSVYIFFPIIDWTLFLLVTSQVLIIPFYNLGFFLEANSNFKQYGISLIFAVVITTVLRVVILLSNFFENKLLLFGCTYVVEILIAGILFKRFLNFGIFSILLQKPRRKFALSMLVKSRHSFFSAIIGFIIMKLDLIVIAAFIDDSSISLGDIALSIRLQDALAVIIFSFIQVQSPILFRSLKSQTSNDYLACAKMLFTTITVFTIFYLILSQIFIEDMILLLVGKDFNDVPEIFLARNMFFISLLVGQLAHIFILLDRDYKMIFHKGILFLLLYIACLICLFLLSSYIAFVYLLGSLSLIINLLFLAYYFRRSLSSFS